jgi:hypothetical protein
LLEGFALGAAQRRDVARDNHRFARENILRIAKGNDDDQRRAIQLSARQNFDLDFFACRQSAFDQALARAFRPPEHFAAAKTRERVHFFFFQPRARTIHACQASLCIEEIKGIGQRVKRHAQDLRRVRLSGRALLLLLLVVVNRFVLCERV